VDGSKKKTTLLMLRRRIANRSSPNYKRWRIGYMKMELLPTTQYMNRNTKICNKNFQSLRTGKDGMSNKMSLRKPLLKLSTCM